MRPRVKGRRRVSRALAAPARPLLATSASPRRPALEPPSPVHNFAEISVGAGVTSGAERPFGALVTSPVPVDLSTLNPDTEATRLYLGLTSPPKDYHAPDYELEYSKRPAPGKGGRTRQRWFATVRQTRAADPGTNEARYIEDQVADPDHLEITGPTITPEVAALGAQGEQEHVDDIRQAYAISLQHAEQVLQTHAVGKTFGPALDKATLRRKVRRAIRDHLDSDKQQLGSRPGRWRCYYHELFELSRERDAGHTHVFVLDKEMTSSDPTPPKVIPHSGNQVGSFKTSQELVRFDNVPVGQRLVCALSGDEKS